MMTKLIDQNQNYEAKFGAVFRSSAIFFKPSQVRTTISFANYWLFKNNQNIGIVFTTRNMNGTLVSRKELTFDNGHVLNIEVSEIESGSVEIEVYSHSNLRIPYAAIMCVYETEVSVSMVHSYSRNHSLIELEDGNALIQGRESCWSIRPNPKLRHSAIFHNGHIKTKKQNARLIITNFRGEDSYYEFTIPPLKEYETYIFTIEDIVRDIQDVIEENYGWATLHFESSSSFTRLLVMWTNPDNQDLQVTHSNFDYTSHQTNHIDAAKPAYMAIPSIQGEYPDVIVYPKFSPGDYSLNEHQRFQSGLVYTTKSSVLTFNRIDGALPSRIVTAIKGKKGTSIPYECSLGVVHEQRPPKRFHWMLVSSNYNSTIHLTAYPQIYTIENTPIELIFRLYNSESKVIDEKKVFCSSIHELPSELDVSLLFDAKATGRFSYISLFSHYGGLFVFSSLRSRSNDSITVEHSF